MHEAEVHVFSDVVLCMGKQAMNEPEIKFTRRWNDYLEQYRKSARMVDGEKIGGKARFLQDSGSSSLDTSCTLVQGRKRLATLKSIQMTQKENCMNWQSMLRNCISYRSIHSWRGCIDFQKGEMKKGGANMHFNADDSSVTMVMDLISSANDICIAFGICDYLGKFNEIDVESRRNSASVVLTPSLGERHSASTSAFCSWECLKLCSDSGGKPPATTESTNKNVSCRKSERKDRRRTLSTLSNCRLRRNSSTSGSSFKRGLHETALDCSAYLVEKLTDQPVLKVANYFVEFVPEAELGRSKKEIFFNEEGSAGTDVRVPSTSNPEILIWFNACTEEVQNCRQIAAISRVILTGNQSNETSKRLRKTLQHRMSHW